MIVPLALAVALGAADPVAIAAAGGGASAPVDGALEPVAVPTAAPAMATPARPPRPSLGGWRHALAVGGEVSWLVSSEDSHYEFRSASFGYRGSIGARGAFLDLSYLVPLQARQDGATYTTGDYYRTRAGLDLLLGFNWRWALPGKLEAEAGPGLHTTVIYLPGKSNYREFTASPLGVGAGGALAWRTGARWLRRAVTVGGALGAAWDFRDPAHANDLAHGWMLRAAVTVGLGGRL